MNENNKEKKNVKVEEKTLDETDVINVDLSEALKKEKENKVPWYKKIFGKKK